MAETRELTPAEIEANVKKTLAEAAKAEAETIVAQIAAETARIEKQQQELGLHVATILTERETHKRQLELASDWYQHVYRFSDAVTAQSSATCIAQLDAWHRLDPACEIEIVWTSPGGSVLHGMALFDAIEGHSLRGGGTHKITCTDRGFAASMAGILIQSGDVRRIGRQSYLHVHEISTGVLGKVSEIEDEVDFCKKMTARVVDIFVTRSQGKITERKLRNMFERKELWLSSDEALKFGLVDEVV